MQDIFWRKVLILSPYPEEIAHVIEATGDRWETGELRDHFDWVISYGHRELIREPWLTRYKDHLVNLHIGYLPWNRGAHPNVWAWADGSPHGVTIHHIDKGLDTGDIINRQKIEMSPDDTLASSYSKLREAMVELFALTWPMIRSGKAPRVPQIGKGSYHRAAEFELIDLPEGWETPGNQLAR